MLSSPGCWAAYGEVLAREYGSPEHFQVHRLTVDAYAVQHPGIDTPVSRQSVGLHLLGLHACLELELTGASALQLIRRAVKQIEFPWLASGRDRAQGTVADVQGAAADASSHSAAVKRWAGAAWAQYASHHNQVRVWVRSL